MDEFDKIREISEDLTHRREPTFENLTSQTAENTSSESITSTEQTNRNESALNSAFADLQSDSDTPFTSPFASDSVLNESFMEEKKFSSMKIHLIGLTLFAGILAVVLAGFFIFNNEPEDMSEVVTITAEPVVIKELPEKAGGINIPDQDKLVYNRIRSENVAAKVESLFPEPEKPVMPQILSIEDNTPEQKFVDMNAVKPINPLDEASPAAVQPTEQKNQPAPVDQQPVTRPSVVQPQPVQQQPAQQSVLQPKPVQIQPKSAQTVEPTPVPEVIKNPEPKIEPVQIAQPSVKKEEKVNSTAENAAKKVQKGAWRVQLFASNNKAAVEKAWLKIQQQQKAMLSGLPHEIETATIAGKGQFYRLKVGSFASREAAAELCGKLKAHKQDCMPVK